MTPSEFMVLLGLRDHPTKLEWVDAKLRAGGYNPKSVSDSGAAGELLNNSLFYDEEIAQHTLNGNFQRILGSLTVFQSLLEELKPARVADLGGGVGILSLFGASLWPESTFDVYDRSQKPLDIGSAWASKLELSKVRYIRVAFQELSVNSFELQYDIAQFEYVLDLHIDAEAYLASLPGGTDESTAGAIYDAPFAAAQSLVREGGFCIVRSGSFDPEGVEALIDSSRRNGFSLDSHTSLTRFGLTLVFEKESEIRSTRFQDVENFHTSIQRSMET
jgi:methylase of polypeptide subunit release factors